MQALNFLTQHGGAKVDNFLTLARQPYKSVIAFFLFTDKRTKFLMISFHSMHVQYGNLTSTVVQIAYTFAVILCQEWNRAITRKYQSILR